MAEYSSTECNSIEHDFHKTPNICPNLNAVSLSDQQQCQLTKSMKLKIILLLTLKKEN